MRDAVHVTHGPMLGRPGAHQMGVWARTSRPGEIRVWYSSFRPLGESGTSDPVATRLDHDNAAWVLLTGLKSDTKYFYMVLPDGPGGVFRTLPDPDDTRDANSNPKGLFNFRFEYGCGNNQGTHGLGPELPTFQTMLPQLRDRIHFAVLNGDWLYEDRRDFPASEWIQQAGATPRVVEVAPTITAVWQNYKTYLERGKPLAEWHRNVPSYYTYDDHEIVNDVVAAGQVGERNRRAVFRDIGVRAWFDYLAWSNPPDFKQRIRFGRAEFKAGSDVLTDPKADFTTLDRKEAATLHVHWGTPTAGVDDPALDGEGGDPNAGIYEIVEVLGRDRVRIRPAAKTDGEASYSIGRMAHSRFRVSNCDFFLLDTRSHRDRHDIKRPDKPGVSMLGKAQLKWLMESMAASDADFFFLFSSVNLMIPHVGAGGMAHAEPDKDDAWTAFLDEREKLIKFWDGLKRPVFILTGDLHNSWAVKVTDRVWEFASGPHNSRNHPASAEGHRPPSGPFDSRGRKCDIRWSTWFSDETPRELRAQPVYCVVQVNNVFRNPAPSGKDRWVVFPRPQVVFQWRDGFTGELLYSDAVSTSR